MFKFFWIICLVILAIAYLGYGVFIIYEAVKKCKAPDDYDTLGDYLHDVFDTMFIWHEDYIVQTSVFLSVGIVATFIASLIDYICWRF